MNKDYSKYKCNFIKQYEEPIEKYNIFSFSIFYMKKYTRHYKNFSKDISIKRQNLFLYNLVLNINNLENGFFGNNWYFRMAVGETGSENLMDRPKYFSDQIYNKVCLQSLSPSELNNPGGPGYLMDANRSQSLRDSLNLFANRLNATKSSSERVMNPW